MKPAEFDSTACPDDADYRAYLDDMESFPSGPPPTDDEIDARCCAAGYTDRPF